MEFRDAAICVALLARKAPPLFVIDGKVSFDKVSFLSLPRGDGVPIISALRPWLMIIREAR